MRRPLAAFAPVLFLLASSLLIAGDPPPWSDTNGMGEPSIVLIHSAGSDRGVWDLVMPGLVRNHRVVRVELPGHGASPAMAKVNVKSVAAAIDRALEKEKVERAILVGHSYGAWVALEEAVAHPKRAAAVVVIDMGAYTPQDSTRTASLETHDGQDGKVKYVSTSGDLDAVGTWKLQVYIAMPGVTWRTEVGSFNVKLNLSSAVVAD